MSEPESELTTGGAGEQTGSALARQRAEQRLQSNAKLSLVNVDDLAPADVLTLLHELRVHQIELEMQNEELRDAQAALDAVRERYFDLYDLAPVGYCSVNEAGLVIQANLTAAGLFGIARNGLIKHTFLRRIQKEDQDRYYLRHKLLLQVETPQSVELRLIKEDDSTFWAELTMTVSRSADGVAELRVAFIDISERKRAETERGMLDLVLKGNAVKLEQAVTDADKANRAKSEFLSGMSHELRTPLHAILGFAQLMDQANAPLTQSQQANVGQILKAGWHLLKLVDEILDLAAVEAGKIEISLAPVALADVLRECVEMIAPMAQQRAITLSLPAREPLYCVYADPSLLKQVLLNLLSNAIKYNHKGGNVAVQYEQTALHRLRITVTNTGAGLGPEQISQLFQPFNRLGQESGDEGGTGIGLVLSQRLVELMEGQIGAYSTVGRDTTFWVDLSLTEPAAALELWPAIASPPVPPDGKPKASPRTLLYVEDNPANVMLIEAIILRQPSIRLLTARDGLSGLAMARECLPDMILMDINLPGMSGVETLQQLLLDASIAHIPVIALSANAMAKDIELGLRAGFAAYLTKPIKINELLNALGLSVH
jgi:PAS domain S-box-containing protein